MPQSESTSQAVCAVSPKTGNSSTPRSDIDAISRQRILADDELTEYLISHSFHKLMTSPESEKRYWLERLHWWIEQRWPTVAAS